ncbi:hypothetical protein CkaCkLH20_10046 [Colletotrichum karsti]|uniref:MARVEL domain-containing protein n=1 Tax=Colletotrichum karsti TaxID=1095194 RepID=A0A9P6LDZ4_9PEZI|nr:uncharacterized protein CkaCkLH20_10046 [Colletotrichum karsti]KAF9872549.1 hypothetical protein CkaCkLH20_10046 [Colletotrichum karsti]
MDNTQQQPYVQPQAAPQQQQQQQHQPQHHMTAPSSATENTIITTPVWLMVIRGFQFFLAIIILGLSAAIIHWVYMDELGLSLAMSLFTWIIVLYAVLTEKIPGLRKAYHVYAVLALDLFLCILWLSTMGATAARRSTFTVSVTASCSSDGSTVNSGRCTILKRYIVMGQGALAMFSAIAGLSALQLILFLVTFIWTLVTFLKWRKTNAPIAAAGASQGEIQMETKQPLYSQSTYSQQQQVPQQQQQQQQQHVPQEQQPYYPPQAPQQQYQQQPPQQYQEMPAGQQYQQPNTQAYEQQNHLHQQQQHPQAPYHPSPVSAPGSPPPQEGYNYPPQELR